MKTLNDIQFRNTVSSAFGREVSDEFMTLLITKLATLGVRREAIYYAYPYKKTRKYDMPHLLLRAVIRVCMDDRTTRRVRLSSTLDIIEQVDETKKDSINAYHTNWKGADPCLEMGDYLDDREPSS